MGPAPKAEGGTNDIRSARVAMSGFIFAGRSISIFSGRRPRCPGLAILFDTCALIAFLLRVWKVYTVDRFQKGQSNEFHQTRFREGCTRRAAGFDTAGREA